MSAGQLSTFENGKKQLRDCHTWRIRLWTRCQKNSQTYKPGGYCHWNQFLCKTIVENIQLGCFHRTRLSGMENINIVSSLNIVQSLCFWGKNCVFSLKLLIYHVLELFRQGKISLYLVNRIYTKNVTCLLKYKENGFPEVLALIVYHRQQNRKYCKRVH